MSNLGGSERGTYDSSSRVDAAWQEAPEAWRTIQQDQLVADLTELRARAESIVEDGIAPKRAVGLRRGGRLAFR